MMLVEVTSIVAICCFYASSTVNAVCLENAARLYVTGGTRVSRRKEVDAFCLPEGSPIPDIAPLPSPRYGHGAAVAGGLLYVIGGSDSFRPLSTVDFYVPSPNNTWFPSTPMSTARAYLGVCKLEHKIYAIGGRSSDENGDENEILSSGEAFDPTTKLWTPITAMTTKRYMHAVGVLHGKIYAVGGYGSGSVLNSVERYDPVSNEWSRVSSMQSGRRGLSAAVVGDRLYSIGDTSILYGSGSVRDRQESVEVYDQHTDRWSYVDGSPLRTGRWGAAGYAAFIYVITYPEIYTFNTQTNVWNTSTNISLSIARSWPGVVAG